MQTGGGGSTSAPQRVLGDINKQAAVGEIGEYVQAVVAQGGAVALTTGTNAQVAIISLTAGEWDLSGTVDFLFAGTTSYTQLIAAFGFAANPANIAGLPSQSGFANGLNAGVIIGPDALNQLLAPATVPGVGVITLPIAPVRIVIPGNYSPVVPQLIAQATFTVAALSAYGSIRARRVQ